MKYKLLEAENATTLSNLVMRYLDNGWSLYGSPMVTSDAGEFIAHYQAVIKKDRVNPMSQS